MKALSIRQPWAWLIANGFKDIENRSWKTNLRGEFLIHAGKAFDSAGYEWVRTNFPTIPMPAIADFERGGIVGRATLIDCFPPESHRNGKCSSPWYFGEYGFLVKDASPLPFQAIRGKLSFFEIRD